LHLHWFLAALPSVRVMSANFRVFDLLLAVGLYVSLSPLVTCMSDCSNMQVVGEAANSLEQIDLLSRVSLDVLMLDLMMTGQSVPDRLARINAKAPGIAMLNV
jgi:DNA-binding NarL/FixJ family response regulator